MFLQKVNPKYDLETWFDNHGDQVTRLKKQKLDLENRLREQEEELDDLAGQVYYGDDGDAGGGEGGHEEELDDHFVQFLSLIDGLKLSLTCNLEVTKTTMYRFNS